MAHVRSRRYEPYQCNAYCQQQELKIPRRSQKKQALLVKRNISNTKVAQTKLSINKTSQRRNECQVGDYILSDIQKSSKLCKATHLPSGEEFCCSIVGKSNYQETLAPYLLVKSHEHINQVVDIVYCKDLVYLMFEKSFGDLHSYIRSKRKLRENEAAKLFRQIVEAVCHCHDSGVIIRDLKLRKFVFKDVERTQLKLQTLDSVHVIEKGNTDLLYSKHGCPAYVSPEILESTNGYSAKAADVWSLGVVVFTMLSGRYPFHEQEPNALFTRIKTGQYVIPDFISAQGKCLIQSILRKTSSERLTAEELLEHPWFHSDFENLSVIERIDIKRFDQRVPDLNLARPESVPVL